jgi:hypothetical protein
MNVRAINHAARAVGAVRAVSRSLRVVDYAAH